MIYRRPDQPSPRIVAAYTPRWKVRSDPPIGGSIHLPSIPTVVYSTAKNVHRKRRCEQWMSWAGFTTWLFVDGTPSVPHHATIGADHARLLEHNEPPLLILEDDAEPAEWRSNITPPADAEVLYLGAFKTAPAGWQKDALAKGFQLAARNGFGFMADSIVPNALTPGAAGSGNDWFRCAGMWGCHGVLWLSKPVMLRAAAALLESRRNVDDVYAHNQASWKCYCAKRPLLWQNDGHHRWDTIGYWPPYSKRRHGS